MSGPAQNWSYFYSISKTVFTWNLAEDWWWRHPATSIKTGQNFLFFHFSIVPIVNCTISTMNKFENSGFEKQSSYSSLETFSYLMWQINGFWNSILNNFIPLSYNMWCTEWQHILYYVWISTDASVTFIFTFGIYILILCYYLYYVWVLEYLS